MPEKDSKKETVRIGEFFYPFRRGEGIFISPTRGSVSSRDFYLDGIGTVRARLVDDKDNIYESMVGLALSKKEGGFELVRLEDNRPFIGFITVELDFEDARPGTFKCDLSVGNVHLVSKEADPVEPNGTNFYDWAEAGEQEPRDVYFRDLDNEILREIQVRIFWILDH